MIYNGIDLTDWHAADRDPAILGEFSIPPDAPVAGILAMLRPEKDHDTFLEAAKLVRERVPEARFLIGPGRRAEALGTQARVRRARARRP